mmetsp:Transcript_136324/g.423588  ORF Transcript_136324/g.423588 Transcript_136324/m.423588 type:complete len:293 (-) Transcript_136324:672-1550(-)
MTKAMEPTTGSVGKSILETNSLGHSEQPPPDLRQPSSHSAHTFPIRCLPQEAGAPPGHCVSPPWQRKMLNGSSGADQNEGFTCGATVPGSTAAMPLTRGCKSRSSDARAHDMPLGQFRHGKSGMPSTSAAPAGRNMSTGQTQLMTLSDAPDSVVMGEGHVRQVRWPVFEANPPMAHSRHSDLPGAAENFPATQSSHKVSPIVFCARPTEQFAHFLAPRTALKVPTAHLLHTRPVRIWPGGHAGAISSRTSEPTTTPSKVITIVSVRPLMPSAPTKPLLELMKTMPSPPEMAS